MKNTIEVSQNNKNVEGYKVPGDGNAPNSPAVPGNKTFEEKSVLPEHQSEADIPGKEFNTGDKAFFDSSKEDFVETVSRFHHANLDSKKNNDVDLSYKKPDGDR